MSDLNCSLLFRLISPLYTTRISVIMDWLERKYDLILVWPEEVHWYSLPSIEHASNSTYDETA